MGRTVWALVLLVVSAVAEVQLITEPEDGKDEYVLIKTGNTDTIRSPSSASTYDTTRPGFSTAHSWPEKLKPRSEDEEAASLKVRDTRQVSYHEGMKVQVVDEGQQGELHKGLTADPEERKIMARKLDVISKKAEKEKKEEERLTKEYITKTKEGLKKVQIELEGNSGVKAAPVHEDVDDIAVPQQKYITPPQYIVPTTILPKAYDVIAFNKPGEKKHVTDEGTFDFVDSPLGDKQLVSSGSSQASRVNVKKGPNGQDYEYEYVYYYYDEDDELIGPAKPGPVSTRAPHSHTTEPPRSRHPVSETDEQEIVPVRNNGRNRYTTIERNRPTGVLETGLDAGTTPEPASNEVLPQTTRGGNRFRGNQRIIEAQPASLEAQPEERLPANTRFPPRSRANSITTQAPPQTDTPITRIRGSVKRPSLELVDSSSFRTHSSDVSPDQDHSQMLSVNDQELLSRGQRVRPVSPAPHDSLAIAVVPPSYGNLYGDSDVEERVSSTTTTTTTEPQTHTTTTFLSAMTDKAAFDLYALLRETENEQSNLLYNEPSTSFEEGETTDVNETTQPTTTSVVTTVPTTTSTTTTTTTTSSPPAEPQLPGRGRYRGGVGSRNKLRVGAAPSTTPSTEAEEESVTKRGKFSPNRNRDANQVSPYGRRGSKTTPSPDQSSSSSGSVEATPKPAGRQRYRAGSRNSQTSSTSESPATSTSSASRPTFGADRYNSRRRGGARVTSTVAPVPSAEADSEAGADDSTSVSSTVRPNRPRLNIGGAVRPLRPGPKINIGGRARLGAQSTTAAAPVSEEPEAAAPQPADISEQPEVHEQTAETTTAQPDALTRLRNRPRLHVGAKAKPVATQGPQTNRRALVSGLLPRRRAEASTETTVTTEEAKLDEESETVPTVLSTTELATPQDRLSSLVGGRRRLPGRRVGPLSRPASSTE